MLHIGTPGYFAKASGTAGPVWKCGITVAAALVGMLAFTASATADDAPEPGSPCTGADLARSTSAHDGGALRCIASDAGQLTWFPNTGAVDTIAGLQAQGYTVTLDRTGDNPLETCIVTEVHNAMTTAARAGSGGTTPGGVGSSGNKHSTTIVLTKTIDVSLDCTAPG